MANNIFPRRSDGYINLEGRTGDIEAPVSAYKMELTLSPSTIEPGQAVELRLSVTKDGDPIPNKDITFSTTNPAIGHIDEDGITNTGGLIVFQIIGLTLGVATIQAFMEVEGDTVLSNQVTFIVVTQEAAENYNATGYGRVVLTVENPFINALYAKPQRLSHMEQKRKYPGDTGLSRCANYEAQEIIFMPAWMYK